MYAIIETGGKQYRVKPGDAFQVEKLKAEPGEKIEFDKVLLVRDGDQVKIGTPYLETARVFGTVVESGKGPKVITFKFKAKKDYRKKQGHRQPYTLIEIGSMVVDGKETVFTKPVETKAKPKAEAKEEGAKKPIDLEDTKDASKAADTGKAPAKAAAESAGSNATPADGGAKEEE
jgi:large subunit ribosomal protein L21